MTDYQALNAGELEMGKCTNCGITIKDVKTLELERSGCRNYCSKECCDDHHYHDNYPGATKSECPCF